MDGLSPTSSGGAARPELDGGLRVVIAADHALVGESVRSALVQRGYLPVIARRRFDADRRAWTYLVPGPRSRTDDPEPDPEVGILLPHSFEDQSPLSRSIVERLPIPWLVLAPDDLGPTWGAFYVSGATHVVPATVGLDEVCALLDDLGAGRVPSSSWVRGELIGSWRRQLRDRDELLARVHLLTPRERQVLQELHQGVGVRCIAEDFHVSEATVRTQVKTILRKLNVSSQIAAVAAYAQVVDDLVGPVPTVRELVPQLGYVGSGGGGDLARAGMIPSDGRATTP